MKVKKKKNQNQNEKKSNMFLIKLVKFHFWMEEAKWLNK